VILNNLEFDHADIFPDLAAIQKQFHHLVRTVPNNGLLISPQDDAALNEVLAMGCWTPQQKFSVDGDTSVEWRAELLEKDGSAFAVFHEGKQVAQVLWAQTGL